MTINTIEQEIAEYREKINDLIFLISEMDVPNAYMDIEVKIAITSANWTLDKYSKKITIN
tara:strand:+ start:1788 stop:1967 length:180 start_codon:yes stop_codon:yes gene_type:complete